MKIVSYLDNDQLQRSSTGHTVVYALEDMISASKEQLCKKYLRVSAKLSVDWRVITISNLILRLTQYSSHLGECLWH